MTAGAIGCLTAGRRRDSYQPAVACRARGAGRGHRPADRAAAAGRAESAQPQRAGDARADGLRLWGRTDAFSLALCRGTLDARSTGPLRLARRSRHRHEPLDGRAASARPGRSADRVRGRVRADRHRAEAALCRQAAGLLGTGRHRLAVRDVRQQEPFRRLDGDGAPAVAGAAGGRTREGDAAGQARLALQGALAVVT